MLDDLLERKGMLSRQIGEAKRCGNPVDELLSDMKQVSSEISRLKKEQKQAKKKLSQLEVHPNQNQSIPGDSTANLFSNIVDTTASVGLFEVRALVEGEYSVWDEYVYSKPNSSIYHLTAFKSVIESSFKHKTIYLAAFTDEGKICGVLPAVELNSALFGHFIVSLPYFTYGGALADTDDVAARLYESLFEMSKLLGVGHVEMRATSNQNSLQNDMPAKLSKVSMVRSLPGSIDQLWEEIGSKVRAQIKKAQRFDLDIKFGGLELIDDFYRVFAENMRDLGTPVYSRKFFKELMSSSLQDKFVVGVVYFQGRPVSTCFLMQHKGMMEIPWASALNSVNHMNVNMFMYWEVLQLAIRDGNKFFDFGRSSKDAGTYRFKKQWGAQPQQLFWYYWLPNGGELPELNPNNPKYKLLIAIWQKMPVWLTKWIGPPVVKFLP